MQVKILCFQSLHTCLIVQVLSLITLLMRKLLVLYLDGPDVNKLHKYSRVLKMSTVLS